MRWRCRQRRRGTLPGVSHENDVTSDRGAAALPRRRSRRSPGRPSPSWDRRPRRSASLISTFTSCNRHRHRALRRNSPNPPRRPRRGRPGRVVGDDEVAIGHPPDVEFDAVGTRSCRRDGRPRCALRSVSRRSTMAEDETSADSARHGRCPVTTTMTGGEHWVQWALAGTGRSRACSSARPEASRVAHRHDFSPPATCRPKPSRSTDVLLDPCVQPDPGSRGLRVARRRDLPRHRPEALPPVGTTETTMLQDRSCGRRCAGECTWPSSPRLRTRNQPGLRHLGWATPRRSAGVIRRRSGRRRPRSLAPADRSRRRPWGHEFDDRAVLREERSRTPVSSVRTFGRGRMSIVPLVRWSRACGRSTSRGLWA